MVEDIISIIGEAVVLTSNVYAEAAFEIAEQRMRQVSLYNAIG
jgi:hypothetical protein